MALKCWWGSLHVLSQLHPDVAQGCLTVVVLGFSFPSFFPHCVSESQIKTLGLKRMLVPLLGIGKCNANAPIWEFLGHPMAWDPQESIVEAGDILSVRKHVGPL